jgi:hypothetical protein
MVEVMPAERYDFFVTANSEFIIFVTVVSEKAFHEPGLGVVRIYVEDSVEEYLGDLPPFFRYCPGGMATIYTDHGVIMICVVEARCSEDSYVQHVRLKEK